MGQMRSKACPVCDLRHDGKWTCPRCLPIVNVHRELFRNLQGWHSALMQGEVDDVIARGSVEFCLWDILRLYDARDRLAEKQALAIELCLYRNIAESNAAEMMGISPTSPVSIYATVGLSRLLGMSYRGEIHGYRIDLPPLQPAHQDHEREGAA